MKARIVQQYSGGLYEGQVYGIWNFFDKQYEGWETVTGKCFTKLGARYELEKWKKQNCPEEFDL